jgi:MFS family permease
VNYNTINMIVTTYFLAYGIAGLFLFPLPDRYGCKSTMAVFGSLHLLSQILITYVPNYSVRLVAFGIMGCC